MSLDVAPPPVLSNEDALRAAGLAPAAPPPAKALSNDEALAAAGLAAPKVAPSKPDYGAVGAPPIPESSDAPETHPSAAEAERAQQSQVDDAIQGGIDRLNAERPLSYSERVAAYKANPNDPRAQGKFGSIVRGIAEPVSDYANRSDKTLAGSAATALNAVGGVLSSPLSVAGKIVPGVEPAMNAVGGKIDEAAQGLGYLARGMPEGPKVLRPGEKPPGEDYFVEPLTRAVTNFAAPAALVGAATEGLGKIGAEEVKPASYADAAAKAAQRESSLVQQDLAGRNEPGVRASSPPSAEPAKAPNGPGGTEAPEVVQPSPQETAARNAETSTPVSTADEMKPPVPETKAANPETPKPLSNDEAIKTAGIADPSEPETPPVRSAVTEPVDTAQSAAGSNGVGAVPPESKPAEAPAPKGEDFIDEINRRAFGKRSERGAVGDVPGGVSMDDVGKMWDQATRGTSHVDRLFDAVNAGVRKLTDPVLERAGETKAGQIAAKTGRAFVQSAADKVGEGFAAAKRGLDYARRAGRSIDDAQLAKLSSALKGTDKAFTDHVAAYLSDETDTLPSSATPEQRAAINAFAEHNNTLRDMEVKAGTLSPEARAEFKRHLVRRYEAFAAEKPAPGGRLRAPKPYEAARTGYGIEVKLPEADARALLPKDVEPEYLKGMKKDGDTQTLVKFADAADRDAFRANLDAMAERAGKKGGDLVARSFDKMTPEEETALGRVRDPVRLANESMRQSRERIARATFFDGLKDVSDAKGKYALDPLSSEATRATRPENVAAGETPGYSKMTGKNWGGLDGKLVRNDVKAALEDSYGGDAKGGFWNGLGETFKGWNGVFKESHGLANAALAARHLGTVLTQLRLSGMEPLNPTNWPRIAERLRQTADGGKYGHEVVGHGFKEGAGFLAPEEVASKARAAAARPWNAELVARAIASGGVTEGFGTEVGRRGYLKGKEIAGAVINKPYEAVKRIVYAQARETGMSPEDAAAEVRKWTLSPGDVSQMTKDVSNLASPFLRFRVGMARIAANAAREQPVRLAADRLQTAALRAGIAAAVGLKLTQAEKDAIDEEHPGSIAYGRDEKGRPELIDARYFDPFADAYPGRENLGDSGWTRGRKYVEKATGLGDNPLLSFGESVATGENRYGQPVEGVGGTAKELARENAPGLTPGVGWNAHKVASALQGRSASATTQRQTPLQAFLEQLGVKLSPLDPAFEQKRLGLEQRGAPGRIRKSLSTQAKAGERPDTQEAADGLRAIGDEGSIRRGYLRELPK